MLANSYCRDYLSASADPIIVMDLKLFKLFVHIIHKSLGCPKANSRLKKGRGGGESPNLPHSLCFYKN